MNSGIRYALRVSGIILLIALACGVGWLIWRNRSPVSRIRHVVLISIDTCRSDHVGCYGAARAATPNIDAMAQLGTLFENVITPVPLTLPAHSSMLTGTNPTYHDVHDNLDYQFSPANVTLAEVLGAGGFVTGGIVSAAVLDARFGLDQGFDEYLDPVSEREDDNESERPGGETTKLALQWLEQHQGDRFFLFLHYFDPHAPYAPPEPFASRFADNPYAGEIAFADDCLGLVIAKLKELGLYDSTLLVITGDHGEMLGEHGEDSHGYFVYQSELRVPLVIHLPGQDVGRRVSDLVGLVDIVPTICSLLDVDPPPVLQGEDLSPALLGGELGLPPRSLYCESFLATRYDANSLLGLVTDRWKYIQTTRPELYDLTQDPQESTNLVDREKQQAASLHGRLQQILREQNRQLADSKVELDERTRRRLESLGYVGSRENLGTVADVYTQDPDKDDPKDVLGFYRTHTAMVRLMSAKDYTAARAMCQQMIVERPQSWTAYYHLAEMALSEKDSAAARDALREVLARSPDHSSAHNQLGVVLQSLGESAEAIKHFQRAAELRPLFWGSHYNLGNALSATRDWEGAIKAYRHAISADPDSAQAHLNLAVALKATNQLTEAVAQIREAIRCAPTAPESHYNLGVTLLRLGQPSEALAALREAARLAPQWPPALGGMAWVLSTCADDRLRNPPEAVSLAERAAEISEHRDPVLLDILAAAYAANGQFERAVATEETAIRLAAAAGDQPSVDKYRRRLQLYQQETPYRESLPTPGATAP